MAAPSSVPPGRLLSLRVHFLTQIMIIVRSTWNPWNPCRKTERTFPFRSIAKLSIVCCFLRKMIKQVIFRKKSIFWVNILFFIYLLNLFTCVGSLLCNLGSPIVTHGLSFSAACGNRSSPTEGWTHVSCFARQILNHWTAKEVPEHIIDYTTVIFQMQYLTMFIIYLDQFYFFLFNKWHMMFHLLSV